MGEMFLLQFIFEKRSHLGLKFCQFVREALLLTVANNCTIQKIFDQDMILQVVMSRIVVSRIVAKKSCRELSCRELSESRSEAAAICTRGIAVARGGLATGTPSPGQAQPVAGTGQQQVPPPRGSDGLPQAAKRPKNFCTGSQRRPVVRYVVQHEEIGYGLKPELLGAARE